MTPTEKAEAFHAALWQASAALELGDVDAARRAIDTVLQTPSLRMGCQRFCLATPAGDRWVIRWQYRAEQASARFVVHQDTPGPAGEAGPFAVTHDPTGLSIAHYASRGEARTLVRHLENTRWPAWDERTAIQLRAALDDYQRGQLRHIVEYARLHAEPISAARKAA